MSIPESFDFDKEGEVVKNPWLRRYFLSIVIFLVALLSFGVGRLTGTERGGVTINYGGIDNLENEKLPAESSPGAVTASSQGTKYYFSHCGNNISERNKVTFATATLAESAGYTLAANCTPR